MKNTPKQRTRNCQVRVAREPRKKATEASSVHGSDLRIRVNLRKCGETVREHPGADADRVSIVEPKQQTANNPPSRRRGTESGAPPRLTLPWWLPLGVVRGEQVPVGTAQAVLETAHALRHTTQRPHQGFPKRPELLDEHSAWMSSSARAPSHSSAGRSSHFFKT